ncbi:cyclic lactone autoinducer peptide [Ruminococcus sp. NK3A76]|nr:cyclic lactone autoinducer peptide [Ruminococcus sp. NK3A76]
MAKASLKTAKSVSCSASLFSYHQPKEPKSLKTKK